VRDPAGNFTTFDADPGIPGIPTTVARGINAGGAVTGYYSSSQTSPVTHGFLREDNGTITSFDPPGSTSTTALSINAVGAITGYYQRANGRVHGFVRHPTGHITSFDPPESTGTYPASINYSGAITGYYTKADGRRFGFVRDAAGTITSFDPGIYSNPTSINDQKVIAGTYAGNTGSSGFLRSPGGTITLLNAPNVCGPSILQPTSINEGGVVTGWCSGEPTRGWVRFPAQPAGPEFVYVANRNSNDVSGYRIDATTGALTAISGSPFAAGSGPRSVAVSRRR